MNGTEFIHLLHCQVYLEGKKLESKSHVRQAHVENKTGCGDLL